MVSESFSSLVGSFSVRGCVGNPDYIRRRSKFEAKEEEISGGDLNKCVKRKKKKKESGKRTTFSTCEQNNST